MRIFWFSAVWARGVCAGTSESRNGKPRLIPHAAQYSAAGNMLLSNQHGTLSPYACKRYQILLLSASGDGCRFLFGLHLERNTPGDS